MDQGNQPESIQDETDIAKLRIDIDVELILMIYRNLATHWWWDGLNLKAQVDQVPGNPNRYNLHQTLESEEYDPLKYPLKPYNLGYLEATQVSQDKRKPIDVKLVCSWVVVRSFWKELDIILNREFPVINVVESNEHHGEPSLNEVQPVSNGTKIKVKHEDKTLLPPSLELNEHSEISSHEPIVEKIVIPIPLNPEKSVKLPKSPIRLQKWRQVWRLIQPQQHKGDKIQKICAWLETTHPNLPHSRSVVSNIIRAGITGQLDHKTTPQT